MGKKYTQMMHSPQKLHASNLTHLTLQCFEYHIKIKYIARIFSPAVKEANKTPFWMTSSLTRLFSSTNSTPSLEARNRRERC